MPSIKVKVKPSVKKKPVKAGSSMPKNIGGAINVKVVAIVRKKNKPKKDKNGKSSS